MLEIKEAVKCFLHMNMAAKEKRSKPMVHAATDNFFFFSTSLFSYGFF
jgi:hypothetical protein